MMTNNDTYSPERYYTTVGDDIKKIGNSKPSSVRTPPPPKPQK